MKAIMRSIALLVLLAVWAGVCATEVYRWTDGDGTVHYSDRPLPDTEPEVVDPLPLVDLGAPVVLSDDAAAGRKAGENEEHTPLGGTDYDLAFANLEDQATVWNDARRLPVEMRLQPPLAVDLGHRLRLTMDGEVRAGPDTHTYFVLEGVDRGTHTLQGQVVNAAGEVLASTPRITIFHKQHSIPTGD